MDQVKQAIGPISGLSPLISAVDDIAREQGAAINFLLTQWTGSAFAPFAANQNNLDIGDAALGLFSATTPVNITGIARGFEGRMLPFVNTGAQPIVLQHQNAGSLPENRIITRTGADVSYAGGATGILWYDIAALRWRTFI